MWKKYLHNNKYTDILKEGYEKILSLSDENNIQNSNKEEF